MSVGFDSQLNCQIVWEKKLRLEACTEGSTSAQKRLNRNRCSWFRRALFYRTNIRDPRKRTPTSAAPTWSAPFTDWKKLHLDLLWAYIRTYGHSEPKRFPRTLTCIMNTPQSAIDFSETDFDFIVIGEPFWLSSVIFSLMLITKVVEMPASHWPFGGIAPVYSRTPFADITFLQPGREPSRENWPSRSRNYANERSSSHSAKCVLLLPAHYCHLSQFSGLLGRATGNPSFDWGFKTNPQVHAAQRSFLIPRCAILAW